MTTDIEALIAEARSHPTIAGRVTVELIDRLADALESTAAERDRLGDALFEAYLATGADPDGATTWQELFRPMTSPSWGAALRGEIERIQAEADSDVECAEAERDALRDLSDEALDYLEQNEDRDDVAISILSRATTTEKGTD